jgi:hypothetical protein
MESKMSNKKETAQELSDIISGTLTDPINAKIISIIGSCKTLHQLESVNNWIERVVKNREERAVLYGIINLRFGQIDCNIDI